MDTITAPFMRNLSKRSSAAHSAPDGSRPRLTLATDIRYALSHWAGLTRFLEDGRLELDTSPVRKRHQTRGSYAKNALFAGHEVGVQNWALLASIVATCKVNNLDASNNLFSGVDSAA